MVILCKSKGAAAGMAAAPFAFLRGCKDAGQLTAACTLFYFQGGKEMNEELYTLARGKTIRETVQASSAVTIPATILEDGIRTYTATFHGEMFMTQEKKVSIPKTYDHLAGVQDNRLPKAAVKRAAGKRKKTITVTWKKLSKSKKKKVSGIEVQYAQDSKFRNNAVIKKAGKSKTSMTLKKLKSKKKYWVRIRTYKIKGGIKYVSRWSRARAVRVK